MLNSAISQGFIQPPPGVVNSTIGKISLPLEFVWLSPPRGVDMLVMIIKPTS